MKRLELLKAIYKALQWDKLYKEMPSVSRQQVDEFFQELRRSLGEDASGSPEAAAKVAGAEALLYCDGASKGNPGPAGIGVVLATPEGEEVLAWGAPIGRATNNVAEYRAVVEGLKKALDLKAHRVRILCDSELLIRQLDGTYKVKNPGLKLLHAEAMGLLAKFEAWQAQYISRDENLKADVLATQHAKATEAPPQRD